jgi:hypothetical protein
MTKKKTPSPNDQRSNVKNPNNRAHAQSHGNRGKQMNPNQKSGGSKKR